MKLLYGQRIFNKKFGELSSVLREMSNFTFFLYQSCIGFLPIIANLNRANNSSSEMLKQCMFHVSVLQWNERKFDIV